MLAGKRPQDLSLRSSSAWEKKALASFSISLARRNSFTSRSSALMRSRSACVTPSRRPTSTSMFAYPVMQCLWHASDLRGNRFDGRPLRRIFVAVRLHHANCSFAYFRGVFVRFLHGGSILSNVGASSKSGAIHLKRAPKITVRNRLIFRYPCSRLYFYEAVIVRKGYDISSRNQ